jgi:Concanavalin A-like lectin/glucanases superfamily
VVLNCRHVLIVIALLVGAGCTQSLFDEGRAGTAGDDDGGIAVPATCPSPCLGDAAADFAGTAGGRWRYLDDHRDRTWIAMAGDATTRTGADPANHITTCAGNPTNPACVALPGALLIASAGATHPADPALELTIATSQVIQLSVHARVASGAAQQIRLYRNSREDVLFTGAVGPGAALDHAIALDALAGDRFLLAVAPSTNGAEVAVQLFANATGAVFPSSCQIAVSFAAATGNTVDNLCGSDFTHKLFDADMETPPALAAGPFTELGSAGDLVSDAYFEGTAILDRTHDTTTQLWVKLRGFVDTFDNAWLFSDLDLNNAGGLGITITNREPPLLDVTTTLTATPTDNTFADALAPYPMDAGWHFVRVVHTNGSLDVCIDGVRKASVAAVAGSLRSTFVPYLGKNAVWNPQGAFVDGELDDVRVLTGALPCE